MSLTSDKSIVFHSTKSDKELAEIIYSGKFDAGKGGGAMLSAGFYANQHLFQAQKNNYGPNILKCEVLGIKDFLFLDVDSYYEVFGNTNVYDQLDRLKVSVDPSSIRTGFSKRIIKESRFLTYIEIIRQQKQKNFQN